MNSKALRILLLVVGIPLVAFAGVRFVFSARGSQFSPPDHGWVVRFDLDHITFTLGRIGGLLCALSLYLWSRRT